MKECFNEKISGKRVSLYNFSRTKDDTTLIKYFYNKNTNKKSEALKSNNYQPFTIFHDVLFFNMEKGEKVSSLYTDVNKCLLIINAELGPRVTLINDFIGNDHKSRENLLAAIPVIENTGPTAF